MAIVPSADDPSVMAGAGTVALELLRQAPSLALILVPVGGGGLAPGTVVAAKVDAPDIRIGELRKQGLKADARPRAGPSSATFPASPS
jgi:threonine dehydratase